MADPKKMQTREVIRYEALLAHTHNGDVFPQELEAKGLMEAVKEAEEMVEEMRKSEQIFLCGVQKYKVVSTIWSLK